MSCDICGGTPTCPVPVEDFAVAFLKYSGEDDEDWWHVCIPCFEQVANDIDVAVPPFDADAPFAGLPYPLELELRQRCRTAAQRKAWESL